MCKYALCIIHYWLQAWRKYSQMNIPHITCADKHKQVQSMKHDRKQPGIGESNKNKYKQVV